ncbi:MAG: endonuclease/exonuclease/phosphatase family protein [Reichenbachiella sp.]
MLCLFLFNSTQAQSKKEKQIIKLMTYNLKFASPTFQPSWEVRREMQLDLIRKYDPDIIGTQEGLKEQIDYLIDHLTEYVAVGEGRQGGDDDEHMVIFFKRDKFRLRELQSFQLSKTPEIIGSGPEINPRMVTWARLAIINRPASERERLHPEDYRGHWENTQEFYVFNTHYFDRGNQSLARLNASKLIMNKINSLNRFGEWTEERPVFLMGDFNCRPGSPPYRALVGDKDSNDDYLLTNSMIDEDKIDWILYRGDLKVLKYEVVDYKEDGVYPSDHKPIYVEMELLK